MTAPRIVRAAAVQIAPDLASRAGTLAKVKDAMSDAAAQGAQIVVFPETFVPWYPYFSFVLPPMLQGAEHLRLYEKPSPSHHLKLMLLPRCPAIWVSLRFWA